MAGKNFTQLDWDDLRHFLALSRAGSFLGAARRLGVEHATISRRVQALEAKLGRKLIDRRGRKLVLTAEGEQVASHADLMEIQIVAVEQLGRGGASILKGRVQISAPPALSGVRLAKPIARLRQACPGIEITLMGEERTASLDRREADIAVRLTRPTTGNYVMTKLGEIAFGLYASKAYLEAMDPADWTFIGYNDDMASSPQQVRLRQIAAGRPIAVTSSVLEFQAATARMDGGLAMLPDFLVGESDTLQLVTEHSLLSREVWMVVHADIKDVPSVRAVADALKLTLLDGEGKTYRR